MPKSKRNKVVHLTKTEKKTKVQKENLVQKIQAAVDQYPHIWVFSVDHMRNNLFKDIREQWKLHSKYPKKFDYRFFMGKNKIMMKAIGTQAENEYQPNLHEISSLLSGQVGILMTTTEPEKVQQFFEEYREKDFARGGQIAPETIVIEKGTVKLGEVDFPASMEPQLRQLGVSSSLVKGKVILNQDHVICKEGQTLTHEQARLLKMFGHQLAEFKVHLLAHWHKGEIKKFE